jgi:hypothetical protein
MTDAEWKDYKKVIHYLFESYIINMKDYNKIYKNKMMTCYYLNVKLHRLDGPAYENIYGDKEWYQNGLLHRIDGPAVEYVEGTKAWYQNGLRHRIDGPAVEFANGSKEWWFEGEQMDFDSQEEFERLIKLKLFW